MPVAPDLSVVVPVYRSAETLRSLHARICGALDTAGVVYEVVFVDDASPDDSRRVLDELAAGDSRVIVRASGRNLGQHRAVLETLPHTRGDWIVVLDADLQDPPEAILDLLRKGREGFAAVFAGRRGRYESAGRLLTSRVFKRLLNLGCGVPPDAGLFVAMNREMADRLLAFRARRPYLVAMMGCTGLPLASVPVARSAREIGRSTHGSLARLRMGLLGVGWVLVWRLGGGRKARRPTSGN